MKKIILSLALLSVIFIAGCTTQQDNDLVNVELYDENGNLITSSMTSLQAIVDNVENVKFVQVNGGMKNEGNVELFAKLQVFAPTPIIQAFKNNNELCHELHVDYVICADPDGLQEGELFFIQTGLIDVETIGYDSHKLLAKATGQYTDETGQKKMIESSKGIILTIEKDPIRAEISVDIGTNSDTPPPPCKLECPPDMVLKGDICISSPIDGKCVIPSELNSITGLCEAKPLKICIV